MGELDKVTTPETVACRICLKEIPKSVAESAEAVEYVYYFCGPECYTQWRDEGAAEAPAKKGST
jgi:YHS domain-containing protein